MDSHLQQAIFGAVCMECLEGVEMLSTGTSWYGIKISFLGVVSFSGWFAKTEFELEIDSRDKVLLMIVFVFCVELRKRAETTCFFNVLMLLLFGGRFCREINSIIAVLVGFRKWLWLLVYTKAILC